MNTLLKLIESIPRSQTADVCKLARLHCQLNSRISDIDYQISNYNRSNQKQAKFPKAELNRLKKMLNRLDNNPRTSYKEVRRSLNECGKVSEHWDKVFGPGNWIPRLRNRDNHPVINALLEKLHHSTSQSRAREWIQRVQLESHEKLTKGWGCVFGTLTANNHSYIKVFGTGATAWQYYRKKCQHRAGMAAYGSRKEYLKHPVEDYFTCIAVTEYGEKTARAHIHYLMYFKNIPFSDPNLGRHKANHKEINELKELWPYGHSSPIAYRYGPNDAYGNIQWRQVPFDNDPNSLALYVCKYILKSYLTKNEDLPWRVRATKNFGNTYIIKSIKPLSDKTLYNLYHSKLTLGENMAGKYILPEPEKHQFQGKTLSLRLKRKLILKETMRRLNNRNTKKSKILKSLKNSLPRPSIVERYTSLMNLRPNPNWQSIGYFPTPKLIRKAIFKFYKQFQLEVCF